MYSTRPNLTIGFHGCDISTRDKIVCSQGHLDDSENIYDWLGHGKYFWEYNPKRALDFAGMIKAKPNKNRKNKIETPAVLGAVINMGYCLDLLENKSIEILKASYEILKATMSNSEFQSLANRPVKGGEDMVLRNLDCAVIETIHHHRELKNFRSFDSIRAVFWEGEYLYPTAGFREKNHIQICIRNPNCIKGYFIPRHEDDRFDVP